MSDLFPGRAGFRQLKEWGFPQGSVRPLPPVSRAFSVIHITGNPSNPIATAEDELAWRINDPGNQNSATFFVNRDGSVWQALGDPLHMDPWSNGDIQNPDLSNPRIAAIRSDMVNPNERTLVAIENVGRPADLPMTQAQVEANARIIAYYHAKAGVPVNRETVIGHYQINAVNRPNCPAIDKSVIGRIVALAAPETQTDMILAPSETFPAGSTVILESGVTYNLYRLVQGATADDFALAESNDGKVLRRSYVGDGQHRPALARMVLDGDTAHAGILIGSGWILSGWGKLPIVLKPNVITPEALAAAKQQTADKAEAQMQAWTANRPRIVP